MGPEARLQRRAEGFDHLERGAGARGAGGDVAGATAAGFAMKSAWRQFLCAFAAAIAVAGSFGAAHTVTMAAANAKVDAYGRVHVRMTFDVLAYALNDTPARVPNEPMDALLDGPADELEHQLADARDRFKNSFAVLADGAPVSVDSLVFPTPRDVVSWKESGTRPRLPVMLDLALEAHLPRSTR